MNIQNIAICGAGPAGLSSAILLNRLGHRVEIFDQFDEPAPVGSGLILQPPGLAVLEHMGLARKAMARGHRIDRMHGTRIEDGRTVLEVDYRNARRGWYSLAIQRSALFDILFEEAKRQGILIHSSRQAIGVREIDKGPILEFADELAAGPFDLVVDATGSRSKLLPQLHPDAKVRELDYGAFWINLNAQDFAFEANTLVQRYRHAEQMIGILPVGKSGLGQQDKLALFVSQKVSGLEATRNNGIEQFKQSVVSCWPETAALLPQIGGWNDLVFANYRHRTLAMPAGGRIVFMGDAAHSTSPQLGQGCNMALLDAAALAEGFTRSTDPEQATRFYCESRRSHVRLYQLFSSLFTPFYQSDYRSLSFFRDNIVPLVSALPPVARVLTYLVAGMLPSPLGKLAIAEPDWPSLLPQEFL